MTAVNPNRVEFDFKYDPEELDEFETTESFSFKDRLDLAFGKIRLGVDELGTLILYKAVAMEFISMFFFICIGVGCAIYSGFPYINNGLPSDRIVHIAFGFGMGIAILVGVAAATSGGHLNPAVTWSMMITGNVSIIRGILYIIFQMCAAIIASAVLKSSVPSNLYMTNGANGAIVAPAVGTTAPLLSAGLGRSGTIFGMEIIGTFILVWTVFGTAVDPRGPAQLAPFLIGLAVFCSHLLLIPLDGCSINPARSFGSAVVNNAWQYQWAFWFGPIIGASIASVVYCVFFMPDPAEIADMKAKVAAGGDKLEGFGGAGTSVETPLDQVLNASKSIKKKPTDVV